MYLEVLFIHLLNIHLLEHVKPASATYDLFTSLFVFLLFFLSSWCVKRPQV